MPVHRYIAHSSHHFTRLHTERAYTHTHTLIIQILRLSIHSSYFIFIHRPRIQFNLFTKHQTKSVHFESTPAKPHLFSLSLLRLSRFGSARRAGPFTWLTVRWRCRMSVESHRTMPPQQTMMTLFDLPPLLPAARLLLLATVFHVHRATIFCCYQIKIVSENKSPFVTDFNFEKNRPAIETHVSLHLRFQSWSTHRNQVKHRHIPIHRPLLAAPLSATRTQHHHHLWPAWPYKVSGQKTTFANVNLHLDQECTRCAVRLSSAFRFDALPWTDSDRNERLDTKNKEIPNAFLPFFFF